LTRADAFRRLRLDHRHSLINAAHFVNISSTDVIATIIDLIENSQVHLLGRVYRQLRGIRQGSSISPQLCNLYLGHMEMDTFGEMLADSTNTLFVRHVDDYLMVTTRRTFAEQFASRMFNGIQTYGISVNPAKTMMNFRSTLCDQWSDVITISRCMRWCGFSIDTQTLRVCAFTGVVFITFGKLTALNYKLGKFMPNLCIWSFCI
jgi:telomerase reverse transcriptase